MMAAPHAERALSLLDGGRPVQAERLAREGLRVAPADPTLHQVLARTTAMRGDHPAHVAALVSWHRHWPDRAAICFEIASVLHAEGDLDGARLWTDKALALPLDDDAPMLEPGVVSLAALKHDRLQLAYLLGKGILDPAVFGPISEAYDRLIALHGEALRISPSIALTPSQMDSIRPFRRRCLHLYHEQLPPQCLRDPTSVREALSEYAANGFAFVDDFLSDAAWAELRSFLLQSSIWHCDAQHGLSYIGAYRDRGGRSRVIEAVAAEFTRCLAKTMPQAELEHAWAYKSVFGRHVVAPHADFARINLNIWLTPDEYNLQPRTGGLVIFDRRAPSSWTFHDYNVDRDRIDRHLRDASRSRISYRANRAVIFDSSLFHSTDECFFAPSYEGMRINVTLLFGDREGAADDFRSQHHAGRQ